MSRGPHLDLDALADLLVGEGDDADVAHVGACDRCSAQLADLDDALVPVSAALAAAPPAPAVPVDLEERLRAALALEPRPAAPATPAAPAATAPERTSGAARAGGAAQDPSRDVVPLRPRRASRALPAVLGAAAASTALLVLVGLGIGAGGSDGASDSGASSAEGGGDGGGAGALLDLPTSATGTDYARDGRALTLALPRLLAGEDGDGTAADRTADGAGLPRTGPSGQDAEAAAPTPAGGAVPAPVGEQQAVDPLARLRDPAELAGCLSALTGPDVEGVPLALDYASYEGAPALVVVLPSARADRVDVFTVGAGCRAGEDQTLLFSRLPRP